MSIFGQIDKYLSACPLRYHTPGHKGGIDPRDITEIDFGEFFPADCIREAERGAAKFYQALHLRFLTNGSSIGVKAAVLSVEGDIIATSNCHRCVMDGASLAGVNVFTIMLKEQQGLPLPPTADEVRLAIVKYPSAKAVVITSPDYYGQTADLKAIKEVTDRYAKLLIVDSAHGAHFMLRPDLFPESATLYGDFVNLSAHKTMHAYTQTAYLCVNRADFIDKVDNNLDRLGTTSPSYIFLGGLEKAIAYGIKNADRYDSVLSGVRYLKKRVETFKNSDFTRVVVDLFKKKTTGQAAFRQLLKMGIAAETYTDRYLVFILGLNDDFESVKRLTDGLEKL